MVKVLITDDSTYMRELIQEYMDDAGYEVAFAKNGSEMLEKYEEIDPDIVLLDIIMPDINGIEVLKELKSRHEDAKVIMCSAVIGQAGLQKEAQEAGAVGFIKKPFGEEDLLNTIRGCLAQLHI